MADWLDAYTAKMRELHGNRRGPFAVGDQVTCRGNWGPVVDPLRVHSDRHPGHVYVIHELKFNGTYYALRDQEGVIYFDGIGGIGGSYFRIAGECGDHFPAWRDDGYCCLRCDAPMPEVMRLLQDCGLR